MQSSYKKLGGQLASLPCVVSTLNLKRRWAYEGADGGEVFSGQGNKEQTISKFSLSAGEIT